MLIAEHLAKNYGQIEAVRDVSLSAAEGEILGILGPNGAGKTTTFKMIVGLLEPSAGRVLIGGHDLAREPVKAKRLFGFIPDRPYLYEKLTAWEFLEFLAGIRHLEEGWRNRGEQLLDTMGLHHAANRLIESYSHGMKQRLTYVAALLHRPKLLIVDEPMVGLDPAGAVLVRELFRNFAIDGGTLIVSTHTLEVAQVLCHRIAIIIDGRVERSGTMEELRAMSGVETGTLEDIFLELAGGGEMQDVIAALRSA